MFSTVLELPTEYLGADPDIRIWGRCSLRENGTLNHVDRAGHPSVSSFFNTDDTKLEYNASEPVRDRERWIEQFIHLMGHTGGYSREQAAFPLAGLRRAKYWPPVSRVDNVHGDRHLYCNCIPIDAYPS